MSRAVWLERPLLPMTVNDALAAHRHAVRKHLRDWRGWAEEEGKALDPIAGPVTVEVHHLRESGRSMPDVGAPMLAVKAVIDGLVDAGVLPNDKPETVTRVTYLAPEIVGHHGLRVIVRPVEDYTTKPQPAPASGPIALLTEQETGR